MKWIECLDCETEFRVVSDILERVEFCPYCGSTVEEEVDDIEDDDFE